MTALHRPPLAPQGQAGVPKCPRGHRLTGMNSWATPGSRGFTTPRPDEETSGICRACDRMDRRRHRDTH